MKRSKFRGIAETRVRHGYRRIHVLLWRESRQVNAKRVHRLYGEEGLRLRNIERDGRVGGAAQA